jgi:hypothetical protein
VDVASDAITRRLNAAAAQGDGAAMAATLAEGLRALGPGARDSGAAQVAMTTHTPVTWETVLLGDLSEPLGCAVRPVPAMRGASALWSQVYLHHVVGTAESVRLALYAFATAGAALAAVGRGPDGEDRRDALERDLVAAWPAALAAEGLESEPPPWLEEALARLGGGAIG